MGESRPVSSDFSGQDSMQEPTSVGVAEGETGLGCRELVEVVQPYHIRHLKLGLSQVRKKEQARAGKNRQDTNFPRKRSSSPKDTGKDENTVLLQPLSPIPNYSFASSLVVEN